MAGPSEPAPEGGSEPGLPGPAVDALEVEGRAPSGDSDRTEAQLVTWLFRDGQPPRSFDLESLPSLASDDANLAWIDLSGYTEKDLRHIADLLHLHSMSVRATLASWQRPRLDSFPDYFFTTVTVARVARPEYRVGASELDLFVGKNFLVSVHKQPLPFFEQALDRAITNPDLVRLDSAFMLYILLDELLTYYEGLIEHLEDDIESVEERALQDTSDDFLSDLLQLKRYVFALGRLAEQHRTVFAAFTRPDFPFVSGDEVEPLPTPLSQSSPCSPSCCYRRP